MVQMKHDSLVPKQTNKKYIKIAHPKTMIDIVR